MLTWRVVAALFLSILCFLMAAVLLRPHTPLHVACSVMAAIVSFTLSENHKLINKTSPKGSLIYSILCMCTLGGSLYMCMHHYTLFLLLLFYGIPFSCLHPLLFHQVLTQQFAIFMAVSYSELKYLLSVSSTKRITPATSGWKRAIMWCRVFLTTAYQSPMGKK